MPEASTPEIIGHVLWGRPLVRLAFAGSRAEPVGELLLVDTGCTFSLVIDNPAVAARLGLERTNFTEPGLLASGAPQEFQIYKATVGWLGQERRIDVHVPATPPGAAVPLPRAEQPIGMLGTGLLAMTKLVVDFAAMTLRISQAVSPAG
jgi:predicted aspartyl protease